MFTKEFIITIKIKSTELHLKIDTCIFDKLVANFENKCYDGVIIKKILTIKQRSDVVFSRNKFPTSGQCDVVFIADYITFVRGDFKALTITEIKGKSIICRSVDHIAYLEMDMLPNAKVGGSFLGIMYNVDYQNNSIAAFKAAPFKKYEKVQAFRVFNKADESDKFAKAIKIMDFKKIKHSGAFKYFRGGKSKFTFDAFTFDDFENVAKLEQGECYFILSPHNWTECFYVAPMNAKIDVEGEPFIKTEAVNIYHMIYKYFCNLYNLETELSVLDENILNFHK